MKKNVMIGAVAGVTFLGGAVLLKKHVEKKNDKEWETLVEQGIRESYLEGLKQYLNSTVKFYSVDDKSVGFINLVAERHLDEYIRISETSNFKEIEEYLDSLRAEAQYMVDIQDGPAPCKGMEILRDLAKDTVKKQAEERTL